MDFQFSPGSSSLVVSNVAAEKGDGEELRTYSGRSAGGKLRVSRRSIKKATPYDRPTSGRHATAGGLPTSGSAAPASSFASRLFGSASRMIASSASYFFPYFFGRKTLVLTPNNSGSVQNATVGEHYKQEESELVTNEENELNEKNTTDSGQEQVLAAVDSGKTEKREFDLARVEDVLRQKSWSREQVSRLTDLLNTQLTEQSPTGTGLIEAELRPSSATVKAVDLKACRDEENTITPISEAQRWREELKRARTDCVPIEVARAYMGERMSFQSSSTRSFRATARQMDRVAELQPPPGLGLIEDRYRSFPVFRSRTRSPAPQMSKKGPLLDEEWMSVGPVRRTRHKMFHISSSPYARALPNVDPVVSTTFISPPLQSSQTARKILDTLEMLSPSPKSKYVGDEQAEIPTPDIFSIQGSQNMHRRESSKFANYRDGRLEFGRPSNYSLTTTGTKKELSIEDKSLVNRLHSTNGVGFFSTTTNLWSSSATVSTTTSTPTTSIHPKCKPLFAFQLPSSKSEVSSTPLGSLFTTPALGRSLESTVSPPTSMIKVNSHFNAEVPLLGPSSGREERLGSNGLTMGCDAIIKESKSLGHEQRPTSLQFGTPSLGSPFTFKLGNSDSPFSAKGLQSESRPDTVSGAESETATMVSPCMVSTPALCSATTTATNASACVASSLFGSYPASSPLFNPPPSGQLFGELSIAKPVAIAPLTIETPSAPFTFSPPPALASCTTPTFSFGNNVGLANLSSELSPSNLEDSNTAPVFNFTSPSGGPKLPVSPCENISLPCPTFRFGAGASPCPLGDSIARSGPIFSFGAGETMCSGSSVGALASTRASSLASGQMIVSGAVTDSLPQQSKFGVQATSGELTGSVPHAFSSVESFQASVRFEAPVSFASGSSESEKSGRKFLKAKRRK